MKSSVGTTSAHQTRIHTRLSTLLANIPASENKWWRSMRSVRNILCRWDSKRMRHRERARERERYFSSLSELVCVQKRWSVSTTVITLVLLSAPRWRKNRMYIEIYFLAFWVCVYVCMWMPSQPTYHFCERQTIVNSFRTQWSKRNESQWKKEIKISVPIA